MPRVKSMPGICTRCKSEVTKQSMTKHLAACHTSDNGTPYIHLRAQGYGIGGEYWMDLALPPDATLKSLDTFLRKTWLECCGHMSAFRIGREELPMSKTIGSLAIKGQKLIHEYDFGSTTELQITVIGTIEAEILGREKVKLLARNIAPQLPCDECGKPAEYLCQECLDEDAGLLCGACAQQHGCGTAPDEGQLRVVNSTRCGVCGYEE